MWLLNMFNEWVELENKCIITVRAHLWHDLSFHFEMNDVNIVKWLNSICTAAHDTHSCLHLPTSAFGFQSWWLSPKITWCFLNDSITVSVMRAIKKWNAFCTFTSKWSRVRKKTLKFLMSLGIVTVVCRSQQENNKYYLGKYWKCILHIYWHISWLRNTSQRLEGVMEQTWERLPLYAVPTQTMACASVDGRAGRRSSGLNRL